MSENDRVRCGLVILVSQDEQIEFGRPEGSMRGLHGHFVTYVVTEDRIAGDDRRDAGNRHKRNALPANGRKHENSS
ncbi:MAG: hypothetical protein WA629_10785, partial [Candidatus Aquilonibacter sp.]